MVFGQKKIFRNLEGDIHIGNNAPEGFSETNIEDVENILKNLNDKKLWRCHVCNDLSISKNPPKTCPTCFAEDAYVEVNENEVKKLLELK